MSRVELGMPKQARPASPPRKGQTGLEFPTCQPVVTRPA